MADEPYNLDKEISSLCATGLRPHILTGVLVRLLTSHFSRERGIQDPQLKSYIWKADPRESRILIEPVWRWLTLGSQMRPALVVKRNALQPRQLALGDGQSVIGDGIDETRMPVNEETVSQVAVVGSHTMFAIATVPAQAELLATEVYVRLIQYQQAIQREFLFSRFRVAEVGPLAKLEESSESFVVPVTVAYSFIDAWSVWSAAPFLKRIVVQSNV
jgi:hypothetical protein